MLRPGRLGRIRLLRKPFPLLLGAAPAPGRDPARPAHRIRTVRRQGRRTPGPARPAARRPHLGRVPARADPAGGQELLRPRLRSQHRQRRHPTTTPRPKGRTRTTRRPVLQTTTTERRVDLRHPQRPARPRTTRWTHSPGSPRPGPTTSAGHDRGDLAQRPHRQTRPTIPPRLRPLTLGLDLLVSYALPGRPFRAENGVVVARRCRRSLVLRGRHLVGHRELRFGPFTVAFEHAN